MTNSVLLTQRLSAFTIQIDRMFVRGLLDDSQDMYQLSIGVRMPPGRLSNG